MSGNKKTIVNLICSMLVLCTNLLIGFWLSPFIVERVGVEANGFVSLASNFVTYATLIVTAINSMAARFITLEYIRKDYKKANLYYNSVFWGNLIIVAVLIVPAVLIIARFEHMFDVPADLVTDVKILFSFIFLNFFLTTGFPNWDCGTYITNRLDRTYIANVISSVLRCVFLVVVLNFVSIKIYVVGIAATIMTVLNLVVAGYNTHKLTPELRVKLIPSKWICSWKAIKELVGAGIWGSISNVGNMLLSGLDLLICNMYIGATAMGVLSISKMIPNYIQQLSVSIRGAFAPELMINYAKDDKDAVIQDLNRAMKLTSIITVIPIAIVVVLGDRFFSLWVPSQDAILLQKLTVLAILGYMFTSGTQILYNVFSTVNKVKSNAIAMLISGVASSAVTVLLILTTDYDIYAVAGVSTLVNLIRNMAFTLPVTAKYLGYKWNVFYKQVITTILCSVILIALGYAGRLILPSGSWLALVISAGVIGVMGLVINVFVILNKSERAFLFGKIMKVLHLGNKPSKDSK